MRKHLPKDYFSHLWRAIIEFDMLAPGDRVLIGLSGGKDSVFLTYALSLIRQHLPFSIDLAAYTLDPMFTPDFDLSPLADFCSRLDIPFSTEQFNIAGIIEKNHGNDPCFSCAFFRRGAVNNFAVKHGFNKVALAHHHDDAVETFFMGLLYSGQLRTFLPVTHLDRTKLTVIRPLIYFREKKLVGTSRLHGFTPIPSPCPFNGKTKRQEIKEMIRDLQKNNKAVYTHLAAAMRADAAMELWPPEPGRAEMKQKFVSFWNKKDR
ncbi:Hypothetical protein LUCI_1089 [Lucifera butyrica]|uniref:tRNA(Ile)-lysidine/2-thiocytidine synthase N-terminal domain-containing protein n=1 Tax=Lucifera butyrica TaxID=1351585 RepID=A0A498R9R2_9FIRM|nr:tRNA 2-thiocytidine biosynthesis TtcA family protein [Lucifera butyrica]VBB05878.1 Hypothetical protein LUCI_1089 [Lucifera butyrica]